MSICADQTPRPAWLGIGLVAAGAILAYRLSRIGLDALYYIVDDQLYATTGHQPPAVVDMILRWYSPIELAISLVIAWACAIMLDRMLRERSRRVNLITAAILVALLLLPYEFWFHVDVALPLPDEPYP